MDFTSRDRFIIGKALLYAIKYVDNPPEHVREQSERNDMLRLLKMSVRRPSKWRKIAKLPTAAQCSRRANQPISESQSITQSRTT
jgi:hypothetical protein